MSVAPRPPWPDLPQELLAHIFDSLQNDVAFLRCALVCTAWRSAAASAHRRLSPLLFVPAKHEPSVADLVDASTRDRDRDRNSIRISLPETGQGRYWVSGSTGGWLITVGIDPPHRIELLNPILKTHVALPQIDHGFAGPVQESIKRGAISTNPIDPECSVLLIYQTGLKLGFCRPGDEDWTELASPETCFSDVVFHGDRFYVTDKKGTILECELGGPNPRVFLVAASVDGGLSEKFLASSSSGDFWVVVRIPRYEGLYGLDDDDEEFKVYRLDLGKREWCKVESLGSDALFLARNGSGCVSSSERFGGNRVHFMNCSSWWCIDLEVYDLGTKWTRKVRESVARAGPVCWIVPQLV